MRRQILLIITIILFFTAVAGAQSEYTVKPGDTYYGISLIYDITVEFLMEYNDLEEGAVLQIGQILKIPKTYEVKPGDTYYGISKYLDISVEELLDLNNRTESTLLLAGETLQIPDKDRMAFSGNQEGKDTSGKSEPTGNGTAGPVIIEEDPDENGSIEKEGSENFFWPHKGSRSRLTGKLTGEQFDGNPGDSIFSVSSGNVIWVAPYRGYNKLIIVKSPDTHVYAYGGNDYSLVKVGDSVFPGMEIGRLGINPHEGEAKAFFFVYKDGKPVDPIRAPRT